MEINVLKFEQKSKNGFITSFKNTEIEKYFKIDQKTDINLNGYQRPAVEKRWREFGEFMASDNGFCPVPIVGNIRLEKHKCEYKDGKILLPDDINIWICEGQHRVLGYKYLWDEFKIKCDIPITLINEKRDEEVVNFFYINQKQKSVQTDLSEINLREYIKKNKVKLHGIKFTDEKQLAVDIVQHLNSDPKGPFYKMIQMTGMSTKSTIKAIPMHNVISEVIPKVSEIVEEEEVKTMTITILNNAWKAIKELMPLSFSDQKEYATLKSAGIYTLNRVIGQSIFNMDSYTHDDFVKMFRSVYLKDIFSDYWWKSSGGDPRGAASFGSSQGSFRRIQASISREIKSYLKDLKKNK